MAEVLLDGADALTETLENASGRRALLVINDCGRQRMRVQRLAKQALMAQQYDDTQRRDALPMLLDAFEATLRELEAAPQSTPEIHRALSSARDDWLRLLRGLHGLHTDAGLLAIAQPSDALLADFERLTDSYERSLQLLFA